MVSIRAIRARNEREAPQPGEFLEQPQYRPLGRPLRLQILSRWRSDLALQMLFTRAAEYYLGKHPEVINEYRNLVQDRRIREAIDFVHAKVNFFSENTLQQEIHVTEAHEEASRKPELQQSLSRSNIADKISENLTLRNPEELEELRQAIETNIIPEAMLVLGFGPDDENETGSIVTVLFFNF